MTRKIVKRSTFFFRLGWVRQLTRPQGATRRVVKIPEDRKKHRPVRKFIKIILFNIYIYIYVLNTLFS